MPETKMDFLIKTSCSFLFIVQSEIILNGANILIEDL